MPRAALVTALATASLAAAAPACGDSTGDGGTTPAGGACRLVGDAIELPTTRNFDVVGTDAGFELVLGESGGSASYALVDGVLGPRRSVALPTSGGLQLAADGGDLFATSVFNATFDGLPVATSSGAEWNVAHDVPSAQGATFTYGSDLAVGPSGDVVIVWIGASGLDAQLLYASWSTAGFGSFGAVATGVATLGNDVSIAFADDGALLVAFTGSDDAGKAGLYGLARSAAGVWTPATRLGGAEGGAQGTVLSSLAITSAGAFAAVVEPADFRTGAAGGLRLYPLAAASGAAAGPVRNGPRDERPVVEGVSASGLADGRVVVSASWGENNFDAAQSDDAVVLYVCGATCRLGLVVDGTRGTFFGPAKVATRGQDGVVVYEAEPKLDAGPDRTVLRRFTCDAPSP